MFNIEEIECIKNALIIYIDSKDCEDMKFAIELLDKIEEKYKID